MQIQPVPSRATCSNHRDGGLINTQLNTHHIAPVSHWEPGDATTTLLDVLAETSGVFISWNIVYFILQKAPERLDCYFFLGRSEQEPENALKLAENHECWSLIASVTRLQFGGKPV